MFEILKLLTLWLAGISLLLLPKNATKAQTLSEQTAFAALALNVVRYTTWPESAQARMHDIIELCVVGDNVVQKSFADIDGKPVGKRTIRINELSRLRNFDQCHVIYFGNIKQNILLQVFTKINKQPLLTIGEGYDFAAQGGIVGIENDAGKIKLHVNLGALTTAQLSISAKILKLANTIQP